MSNIPSFKVGSKPQITQEEYNAKVEASNQNFLNEPGTYDLTITAAKWGKVNEKDDAWVNLELQLQDVEGKGIKHWVMVPTECRNDFLFGPKKTAMIYENLQKFLRAFGVRLEFERTMEQVAQVFADIEKSFVMKTIKARVAREGDYLKYLGKDDNGVKKYQIYTKANEAKFPEVFADSKAAQEFAKNNRTELVYCKIAEFFSPKEPLIVLEDAAETTTADEDFPF